MTADVPSPDERYLESVDYAWTEKAFEMLEHDELQGEVISGDGIIRSRVSGPCPRCRHNLDDRQMHTAVTNLMGAERRGLWGDRKAAGGDAAAEPSFFPIDVSCDCTGNHPGAPAGKTGCGTSFRVELPLQTAADGGRA